MHLSGDALSHSLSPSLSPALGSQVHRRDRESDPDRGLDRDRVRGLGRDILSDLDLEDAVALAVEDAVVLAVASAIVVLDRAGFMARGADPRAAWGTNQKRVRRLGEGSSYQLSASSFQLEAPSR